MIRRLRAAVLAAAVLGAGLAASPAQAAEPGWSRDFLTYCVGNLRDFQPAVAEAISKGYVDTDASSPPNYSFFRVLARKGSGKPWKLAVGEVIDRSTGQPNFIRHCLVEGVDSGTSGAEAIKAWVGLEPDKTEPGYVDYVFAIENGVLKSLAGASRERVRDVFFNGGYWLLSIAVEGGFTSVTLSYTGPVR